MSGDKIEFIMADGEYVQINDTDLNQAEVTEPELADDNDTLWDADSITLLLNMYLQNIEKFRNPKIRKKNVWAEIATAVGKGPYSCDKKFRNLKQTYIRVLKKKNSEGPAAVKWRYFDVFDKIYSDNGEYSSDIQQKIDSNTTESVANALLSLNTSSKFDTVTQENGESLSNNQSNELKKRLSRKRYADFKKVTLEMRDRQRVVEEKLDKLIKIVEDSNNIQRERNRLFEQFLENLNNKK